MGFTLRLGGLGASAANRVSQGALIRGALKGEVDLGQRLKGAFRHTVKNWVQVQSRGGHGVVKREGHKRRWEGTYGQFRLAAVFARRTPHSIVLCRCPSISQPRSPIHLHSVLTGSRGSRLTIDVQF